MAAALASSSCAWLRYEDQIRTHVELMERIAADAGSAVQGAGYRLRPADLQTMAYPLERAAALRKRIESNRVDPALRAAFGDFVGAYSQLYEYLDQVRSTADEPRLSERVDELLAGVDRAAGRVRAALGAGG
ncbi:MAG TPA: hypothetical protein VLA20_04625 [Vicinamibacterales bacterium]|nr:hypothetical protein [Vicinamibacterales bacterium]